MVIDTPNSFNALDSENIPLGSEENLTRSTPLTGFGEASQWCTASTGSTWVGTLKFLEKHGGLHLHVEIRTSYRLAENCSPPSLNGFMSLRPRDRAKDVSEMNKQMAQFKRQVEGLKLRVEVLVSEHDKSLATTVLVDHNPFGPGQS